VPARFEIGLCNSIPDPSTSGASLSGEMSGAGYQRQRLSRTSVDFPTLSPDPEFPETTPYFIMTAPHTFAAAGGTIGIFQSAFLVAKVQLGSDPTVLTDRLICAASTNVNQIVEGDSYDVTIKMTLGV
jgi:hypothetical protein